MRIEDESALRQEIAELKQQVAALQAKEQFLETVLNSFEHLMIVKDRQHRWVWVNDAFCRASGHAREDLVDGKRSDFDVFPEEEARLFWKMDELVFVTKQPQQNEEPITSAAGETRTISTVKTLYEDPSGEQFIVAIARDVTQEKETEREIERLNSQLVRAAHMAGKAELATDVLHNVGNVLNSIGVSIEALGRQVEGLPVEDLERSAALLGQRGADLEAFLREDPKAPLLASYLAALAEEAADGRARLAAELADLDKYTTHIKAIIEMQQAYTRLAHFKETAQIADVIEDAIKINEAGLERHGIMYTLKSEPLPPFSMEKQKVLQILVNLIGNAKDALHTIERAHKRLHVEISRVSDALVEVKVSDNGEGISPENLDRIFAHGFTTRVKGHGFGLHSAANAAQEIGGSLQVESAGPGEGATFTLRMPFELESS